MIRASVTERELERLVPGGEGEHLMAEADAEHVRPAEQLAHRSRFLHERLRVAGARREEDAVVTT